MVLRHIVRGGVARFSCQGLVPHRLASALRQSGALPDAEFDALKARLLARACVRRGVDSSEGSTPYCALRGCKVFLSMVGCSLRVSGLDRKLLMRAHTMCSANNTPQNLTSVFCRHPLSPRYNVERVMRIGQKKYLCRLGPDCQFCGWGGRGESEVKYCVVWNARETFRSLLLKIIRCHD